SAKSSDYPCSALCDTRRPTGACPRLVASAHGAQKEDRMATKHAQTSGGTAVVVGVGPGLGLALVNALAAQGYTVFAAARGARVEKLQYAPGAGRVIPQRCDATQADDVERLIAEAEAHGPLAAAVFNAGTFERGNVVDTA